MSMFCVLNDKECDGCGNCWEDEFPKDEQDEADRKQDQQEDEIEMRRRKIK